MQNYELKIEQFTGPIEKLLSLIEERKMEVTDLSLAEVTADFLNYVNGLKNNGEESKNIDSRILADFIVVAAQLLLIKSRALLPNLELTGEEEKDIKDLENRLQFYRQFKPAMGYLKKLWEQKNVSISRQLFSAMPAGRQGRPTVFYPAENIKVEELHRLVRGIFEILRQLSEKTQTTAKSSLVTLEEKIEEIMKRLGPDLNFGHLAKEKPRSEIVVLFLALLHLLAKQLIKVEQKDKFEEIKIGKI